MTQKSGSLSEDEVVGSSHQLPLKRRLVIGLFILMPLILLGVVLWTRPEMLPFYDGKGGSSGREGIEREVSDRQALLKDKNYKPVYTDYLILGNLYTTKGELVTAERYLLQAEKLAPQDLDVLYALAKVYRLQHNKAKTLRYYDKLIAAADSPNNPRRSNLRGYRAERQAIVENDFELRTVEIDTRGMPL